MLFLAYLRHLALAGDEHSLHSPFLFEFYRSVVKNNRHLFDRKRQFYKRLIASFSKEATIISMGEPSRNLNDSKTLAVSGVDKVLKLINGSTKIELLIADSLSIIDCNEVLKEIMEQKMHGESMFLIDGIYHSAKAQAAWTSAKNNPSVRQTLDFYHFGILLFREKQPRQHFRLRL